jgi:hypothetical protein
VKRALAVMALPVALAACDECAGTPSCHNHPEVSATGQFIERRTGSPVANVRVAFVRRSGIDLISDTATASSDADGHFTLRVGSIYNGVVQGDLLVTPPAPYQPYTVSGVQLETSRVRGDGEVLGRLVVNPYVLLVGHVRDRKTLTPLVGASVTMRRTGGGVLEAAERTFTTDHGGQFSWEPAVIQPAAVQVEFEIRAEGYVRPFVVPRTLQMLHRDNQMNFVIIPVGYGLAYSASTGRRGSGDQPAGLKVQFVRTGGIQVQPSQVEITPDPAGNFAISVEPLAEGTVLGQLRILPPPPFAPETVSVRLSTSDDDTIQRLGFFGFGAQVFMKAELRDASTGQLLPPTTGVTMKRTGGVALTWANPLPEGDLLAVSDSGTIVYAAPAADSGAVVYDMIVRHPAPFIPDTIRNFVIQARFSDSAHVAGTIQVRRRTP